MRALWRARAFLFEQFREQYFDRGRASLSHSSQAHCSPLVLADAAAFDAAGFAVVDLDVADLAAFLAGGALAFGGGGEATTFASASVEAAACLRATTILGFATLLAARHRGIQSLGFVLAVGIAQTLVACLTVMPAVLALRRRRPGAE